MVWFDAILLVLVFNCEWHKHTYPVLITYHVPSSSVLKTTVGHWLVSCPDSLLHTEKESGETHIQFWFRAPRSWCGQSDCRTVLTSQTLFEQGCDATLKGLREGYSVLCRAFSQRSTKLPICLRQAKHT